MPVLVHPDAFESGTILECVYARVAEVFKVDRFKRRTTLERVIAYRVNIRQIDDAEVFALSERLCADDDRFLVELPRDYAAVRVGYADIFQALIERERKFSYILDR